MTQLRQQVTSFTPRRPGFNRRAGHGGKTGPAAASSPSTLGFSLPIFIPPMLHCLLCHLELEQWTHLQPKYQGTAPHCTTRITATNINLHLQLRSTGVKLSGYWILWIWFSVVILGISSKCQDHLFQILICTYFKTTFLLQHHLDNLKLNRLL
jgi:hypothetical protein